MSGRKIYRIVSITILSILLLIGALMLVYTKALPALVANKNVQNKVEKCLNKSLGVNLQIENPVLKTTVSPVLGFKVKKIKLTKGEDKLLFAENFDAVISFEKIFSKRRDSSCPLCWPSAGTDAC